MDESVIALERVVVPARVAKLLVNYKKNDCNFLLFRELT